MAGPLRDDHRFLLLSSPAQCLHALVVRLGASEDAPQPRLALVSVEPASGSLTYRGALGQDLFFSEDLLLSRLRGFWGAGDPEWPRPRDLEVRGFDRLLGCFRTPFCCSFCFITESEVVASILGAAVRRVSATEWVDCPLHASSVWTLGGRQDPLALLRTLGITSPDEWQRLWQSLGLEHDVLQEADSVFASLVSGLEAGAGLAEAEDLVSGLYVRAMEAADAIKSYQFTGDHYFCDGSWGYDLTRALSQAGGAGGAGGTGGENERGQALGVKGNVGNGEHAGLRGGNGGDDAVQGDAGGIFATSPRAPHDELWDAASNSSTGAFHEFCWNAFLMSPFSNLPFGFPGDICTPLVRGYVFSCVQSVPDADGLHREEWMTLICRREALHPGTRRFSQGLNRYAAAANFCEVEAIFFSPERRALDASAEGDSSFSFVSHVFLRGSAPMVLDLLGDSARRGFEPQFSISGHLPALAAACFSRIRRRLGLEGISLVSLLGGQESDYGLDPQVDALEGRRKAFVSAKEHVESVERADASRKLRGSFRGRAESLGSEMSSSSSSSQMSQASQASRDSTSSAGPFFATRRRREVKRRRATKRERSGSAGRTSGDGVVEAGASSRSGPFQQSTRRSPMSERELLDALRKAFRSENDLTRKRADCRAVQYRSGCFDAAAPAELIEAPWRAETCSGMLSHTSTLLRMYSRTASADPQAGSPSEVFCPTVGFRFVLQPELGQEEVSRQSLTRLHAQPEYLSSALAASKALRPLMDSARGLGATAGHAKLLADGKLTVSYTSLQKRALWFVCPDSLDRTTAASFYFLATILPALALVLPAAPSDLSALDFSTALDEVVKRAECRASGLSGVDIQSLGLSGADPSPGAFLPDVENLVWLEQLMLYNPLSEFVPYLARSFLDMGGAISKAYAGCASCGPSPLRALCVPFLWEGRRQLLAPLQKPLTASVSLPSLEECDSPSESAAKQVSPVQPHAGIRPEELARIVELQDGTSSLAPCYPESLPGSQEDLRGEASLESEYGLDKAEYFVLGQALSSLLPLHYPIFPSGPNAGFGRFLSTRQLLAIVKLRAASGDLFSLSLLRSGVFGPSSGETWPDLLSGMDAGALCAVVAYLDSLLARARADFRCAANSLFEGLVSRSLGWIRASSREEGAANKQGAWEQTVQAGPTNAANSDGQNGPDAPDSSQKAPGFEGLPEDQISPSLRYNVLIDAIQTVYAALGMCTKIPVSSQRPPGSYQQLAAGSCSYAEALILRDLSAFDPFRTLSSIFCQAKSGIWSTPSFSARLTELVVGSNYDTDFARRVETALLRGDPSGATLGRGLLMSHAEYCVFSGLAEERERSAMLRLLESYESREEADSAEEKGKRSGKLGQKKAEAPLCSLATSNALAATISFDAAVDVLGFFFTQGQPATLEAKMPVRVAVFTHDAEGREYLVFTAPLQDTQPSGTSSFYSVRSRLTPLCSTRRESLAPSPSSSGVASSGAGAGPVPVSPFSSPSSESWRRTSQANQANQASQVGWDGGFITPSVEETLEAARSPLEYAVAYASTVSALTPPLLAEPGLDYPFPASVGFRASRSSQAAICVRKLKFLFLFDPSHPALLPKLDVVCREVPYECPRQPLGEYYVPEFPSPQSEGDYKPAATQTIVAPNEVQHNLSGQLYTRFTSTLVNPGYKAFLDECPRRDSLVHLSYALAVLQASRGRGFQARVSSASPSPAVASPGTKSPLSQSSVGHPASEPLAADKGFPIMEMFSNAVSTEKIIKTLFMGESMVPVGPISRSLQARILGLLGQAVPVSPAVRRSILLSELCPAYLEALVLDPRILGPEAVFAGQPPSLTGQQKALMLSSVDHQSRLFQARQGVSVLPRELMCRTALNIIRYLDQSGNKLGIDEHELHCMREATHYTMLENAFFSAQTDESLPQYVYKAYYARKCDVRGLSIVPTEDIERVFYHPLELGRPRSSFSCWREGCLASHSVPSLCLSPKEGRDTILALQFSVPVCPRVLLLRISDITALRGIHTFSDLGSSIGFSAIPLEERVALGLLGLEPASRRHAEPPPALSPPGGAGFFLVLLSADPALQTPTLLLKFTGAGAALSMVKLFAAVKAPVPYLAATPFASFAKPAPDCSLAAREKHGPSTGSAIGGRGRSSILAPCQAVTEHRLRGLVLLHFCFEEAVAIESLSLLAFNVLSPPQEAVVYFLELGAAQIHGRPEAARRKERPEAADNRLCDVMHAQVLRLPTVPSYPSGPALVAGEKSGSQKLAVRLDRNGAYTFRSECAAAVSRVSVALFGGESEVYKMTFSGKVAKRQGRAGK